MKQRSLSAALSIVLSMPIACCLAGSTQANPSLQFVERSGLFLVHEEQKELLSANFVFWHGDWKWSNFAIRTEERGNGSYLLKGTGDMQLQGMARPSSKSSYLWDFQFRKGDKSDLFGGISFTLSPVDGHIDDYRAELLPDKSGFEVTYRSGQLPVRVSFSSAPRELFFERGNTKEIRAYFVGKESQDANIQMAVTLPMGGEIGRTLSSRLAKPNPSWFSGAYRWNQAPTDLSFLNETDRPAGRRGFVYAIGEDLVFEDGTRARFWGTNVTAYALFHTPENAVRTHARRLAKLGFNLVRIHHHDSAWVDFNVFGLNRDYSGKLNETALARLDWWIKCLKDEGIYVWLDLHVGRHFSRAEGILNFDELSKGGPRGEAKGFNYINPDIQRLMKDFNASYLGHVNKFTNITYAQDPAIIALLITNENDLGKHFAGVLIPERSPLHGKTFMEASKLFAKQNDMDPEATWRFWEPGPSKLFTSDLEHSFNRSMIDHLRTLGTRAPIATTNFWGEMDIDGLLSLTDGDIIDVHAYGRENEVEANPRLKATLASWLASGAVAGKPMTITEWNVEPFPAMDRAALSPQIAALASLQGWAGMMQYAYALGDLKMAEGPGNYSAVTDPAFIATLPAAALMYRQGHVAPAQRTYVLKLSPTEFVSGVSPTTSRALRTIPETSKLRIAIPEISQLPWVKPSPKSANAIEISDLAFDAIPPNATKVCSDTSEICRDWATGVYTVDTSNSQLVSGWLGGRSIKLKNVGLTIETPNAFVAVQSLDGASIGQSSKILVTLAAQSLPAAGNRLPFLSEPVQGMLSVTAKPGLKAFALFGDGERREVEANFERGVYNLALDASLKTFWILLSSE